MMRIKTLIILLSVIVIFVGALILIFMLKDHRADSEKLAIGIGTWPGFCSGMVGKEKGFFPGIELEHKILDDAPARHAAFQSGNIDLMISSLDVFTQEAAQGIKGKIIIVTDESFGGDGIVSKIDIKSPEQLKGKKVAFARATPSHFLLYEVLKKYNLSPSDVEQVIVDDPSHAGQAFLGGSVDAAVTWEPLLSEVEQKGKGHILVTTKDYPEAIVDVLIASEKLSQNKVLLTHFIEGWLKSVDYIKSHSEETGKIIAKGLNIPDEEAQGMMAGLKFADLRRNKELFNNTDPSKTQVAAILKEAAEFWKSQGIIGKMPDVDSLISSVATEYYNSKN